MRSSAPSRRFGFAVALCALLVCSAAEGWAQQVASTRNTASATRAPAAPTTDEERVTQLSEQLARGSSDKAKLSAIAGMIRLGHRTAVRPLLGALGDPSTSVRALAAAGLGKLGAKSALAPLRQVTAEDPSEQVRTRAREAIRAIIKANDLTDESEAPSSERKAGFGRQARTTEPSPDLYVVVKTCNDDSPGRTDKKTRAAHADLLRQTMTSELAAAPLVTSASSVAKRLSLRSRAVDASVIKLTMTSKGASYEIAAELRLVISDDAGRMLSTLTGGAKVTVPKRGFNWSYLPELRRNAIEGAVRGLFDKLLAHLRSPLAA